MIYCFLFLVAGVLCGRFFLSEEAVSLFRESYDILLYVLLISVGISVGANADEHTFRRPSAIFLLLPAITIFFSLLGGAAVGALIGYPLKASLAIASGLSFSSVTGVIVGNGFGVQMGALAFLANLFREILSFIFVPLVSKKLNRYAAVCLCASTAGDTLLPVLSRQKNSDALLAIYNGVVCTAVAPVLVRLMC